MSTSEPVHVPPFAAMSPRPSHNPFLSVAAAAAEPLVGDVVTPERVDKPWGHEILFATGENGYVGKLIHVTAGCALSLQHHVRKDETISVVSGEGHLDSGSDVASLVRASIMAGDTMHVPPTLLHRISAITDLVLVECSTAAPGWRDDVVRHADDYGRAGTSAP